MYSRLTRLPRLNTRSITIRNTISLLPHLTRLTVVTLLLILPSFHPNYHGAVVFAAFASSETAETKRETKNDDIDATSLPKKSNEVNESNDLKESLSVIEQASQHVNKAHQLLERATLLLRGVVGGEGIMTSMEGEEAAMMEIDVHGNVVSRSNRSSSSSGSSASTIARKAIKEKVVLEFKVFQRELEMLNEASSRMLLNQSNLLGNNENKSNKTPLENIINPSKNSLTKNDEIRIESELKSQLNPELWHQYTYWELHAYFSCTASSSTRPIYTFEKWQELHDIYHTFSNMLKEDLLLERSKREEEVQVQYQHIYQMTQEPFELPTTIFQSEKKGRSLKASRDIHEGELVFRATNNTIIFSDGLTWRQFLFFIYDRDGADCDDDGGIDGADDGDNGSGDCAMLDDETTCDILIWSWIQSLKEGGPMVIVVDLDSSSLLNEGRDVVAGDDNPKWESPNVASGTGEDDVSIMMAHYASRDIGKGEELLCDYREFAEVDAWSKMGL